MTEQASVPTEDDGRLRGALDGRKARRLYGAERSTGFLRQSADLSFRAAFRLRVFDAPSAVVAAYHDAFITAALS
jgi:hypothetical protein